MVIIDVIPPKSEIAETEFIVFQGSMHRESLPFDLEHAELYIQEAVEDIFGIVSVSVDEALVTVAYDPTEIAWRDWYISIIDAIKNYVVDSYPRYGHEVVSRIDHS